MLAPTRPTTHLPTRHSMRLVASTAAMAPGARAAPADPGALAVPAANVAPSVTRAATAPVGRTSSVHPPFANVARTDNRAVMGLPAIRAFHARVALVSAVPS